MGRTTCLIALLAACTGASQTPPETLEAPAGPKAEAPATPEGPAAEAGTPEDVVRAYVAALDRGDRDAAWAMWELAGGPGVSREDFEARHAGRRYAVEVGEPGRPEGAAGSVYVAVPVVVTETGDGETRRHEGQVILRRSTVDGATEAQRAWHLYRWEGFP